MSVKFSQMAALCVMSGMLSNSKCCTHQLFSMLLCTEERGLLENITYEATEKRCDVLHCRGSRRCNGWVLQSSDMAERWRMSRLSTNTGLITQDTEAKTVWVDENGQTQQKKHSTCVSCFSCFTTSSKRVNSRYTTVRQPYALGPARELRKADWVYGCRQLHNGNASAECMEENLLSQAFSCLPEHIMDAKCLRPMYLYLGVR